MMYHRLILFLLVLVVSMLNFCEGDPIPKKGKGRKAFGAGLLTGALAGAIAGNVLTNKVQSAKTETNKHVTTIQNGPILANGCFEQTVRESDSSNFRKFVETVNLVCPTAVPVATLTPVSAVPHTPIPQTLTPETIPLSLSPPVLTPEQTPAQLPITNEPQPNSASNQLGFLDTALLQPTIQIPQDTSTITSQHQQSQQIQPLMPQNPPQIIPEATVQLNPQINSHKMPPHIPQITSERPIPQTPKVYVISKRIEYNNKKSDATNPILGNKYLMLTSIIMLMLFM